MNGSRVLAWECAYIKRGRDLGEVPVYGSPEWLELPAADPRRVAACVIAAQCWRYDRDPAVIAQQLEDELTVRRQLADPPADDGARDVQWRRASSKVVRIATSRNRAYWEQRERGKRGVS